MSVVVPRSVPPTSCQWAIEELKATSSPSQKMGRVKIMWFRCEPMM